MREVTELGGGPPAGMTARLRDRWVSTPALWSRLADERGSALGPGPKLDRDLFPRVAGQPSDEEEEPDDGMLEEAMRMLGYGE
jgi:hypothetical protein